jgi:membrane-associated phospholipid phosphatase
MTFGSLGAAHRSASVHPRVSPVSRATCLFIFILLATGIVTSLATGFVLASLPNILLLIIGTLIVDVLLIHFAPRIALVDSIQSALYGVLCMATIAVCAVLAAYSLQRLDFPLRDSLLTHLDADMGLSWPAYAHWVDHHAVVQALFHTAYDSISLQVVLPVVALAFLHRPDEARVYVLAFAVALTVTIFISALMPAVGPVVFVNRAAFHILHFTGATPFHQLMRLREAGPLVQQAFPGGIATFPSFHATVAILTPLSLYRHRRIFIALAIFNVAMLGGTVSEGAHYFTDVVAGSCMAFFAYALATRIIRLEDSLFGRDTYAAGNYATADVPA